MPHVSLVSLQIYATHFAPFSTVYAWCTFQLRFLSKCTPKYFMLFTSCTILLRRCRAKFALLLELCAKFISISLEYSRGELCVLDQFSTPLSLVIMVASFQWVLRKSLLDANIKASSIYPTTFSSGCFGISIRSAL